VAVIHVHRADRFGNSQVDGYPHMDADIARAATTVLVTAEKIVSEEEIRSHPERTLIPGFAVDALVEASYGAFPHECYGVYEADFLQFDAYVAEIKTNGLRAVQEYLARFVYGTQTHAEYLSLFGEEVFHRQARYARELTGDL
jgi:glutaconate CoA-transferase subunit A